jgi:indole-3-glycerol phosphate synthase
MPADILAKIIDVKKVRVADAKKRVSPAAMEEVARALRPPRFDFLAALSAKPKGRLHVIAEVKKASPSKGVIRADFKPLDIARDYLRGGATALSILTEADHFQGSDEYLRDISREIPLPTLRKDFIVDPYQIHEAKALGASAYLLIVACLSLRELEDLIAVGRGLGLTPLVEVHDEAEIEIALKAGSPVIGINNRDLRTFQVTLDTTLRLRPLIPKTVPVVGESGIFTRADLESLAAAGAQAALIGESLMRENDIAAKLGELLF